MRNKWLLGLVILMLALAGYFYYPSGERAADFSLENWDGSMVTMDSLKGKVVIMTFSYAHCSVRCPVITVRLSALDDLMGAPGDVVYLHVGIDPENDTIENRTKYFGLYEIDAEKDRRWMFVSGETGMLSRLWEYYGVDLEKIEDETIPEGFYIEYSPKIIIIDKEGYIRHETDSFFLEDELAGEINKAR